MKIKPFLLSEAIRWRKRAAARLDRGLGWRGQRLRPKKFPNGRPLGYHATSEGVPGRIRRSVVTTGASGFTIHLGAKLKDFVFNEGRSGPRPQPPRPYAGIDRQFLLEMRDNFVKWLRDQGRRGRVFK